MNYCSLAGNIIVRVSQVSRNFAVLPRARARARRSMHERASETRDGLLFLSPYYQPTANSTMSSSFRLLRRAHATKGPQRALLHSSGPQYSLHHEWIGDSSSNSGGNALFLHGLLGNGKNIRALAKNVVQKKNTGSGLLLDLRGHGRSPSLEGPHTFDACVQDVHRTLDSHNAQPSLVMGHSWGGRIALQYVHSLLEDREDELPALWLLDTVPGQAHDSVQEVLGAVFAMEEDGLTDRKSVATRLVQEHGLDTSIAQWLAASLKRGDSKDLLKWGFDVDVVKDVLPQFENQNFHGMVRDILEEGGKVHLVRGGRNGAWEEKPEILEEVEDLKSYGSSDSFQLHTLENAGHWVHVDDLPGLLELVERS